MRVRVLAVSIVQGAAGQQYQCHGHVGKGVRWRAVSRWFESTRIELLVR